MVLHLRPLDGALEDLSGGALGQCVVEADEVGHLVRGQLLLEPRAQLVGAQFAPRRQDDDGSGYIHRGIATRSFERRFGLADHVTVRSADMSDGLLSIDLVREIPEAMRPRKIELGSGQAQTIESGPAKTEEPELQRSNA